MLSSASAAILENGGAQQREQPRLHPTKTANDYSQPLLLQAANVRNDSFHVVGRKTLYRGRVLRRLCHSLGQVGVGLLLRLVGNQAWSFHRGLASRVRAMGHGAFCLVQGGSVRSL